MNFLVLKYDDSPARSSRFSTCLTDETETTSFRLLRLISSSSQKPNDPLTSRQTTNRGDFSRRDDVNDAAPSCGAMVRDHLAAVKQTADTTPSGLHCVTIVHCLYRPRLGGRKDDTVERLAVRARATRWRRRLGRRSAVKWWSPDKSTNDNNNGCSSSSYSNRRILYWAVSRGRHITQIT